MAYDRFQILFEREFSLEDTFSLKESFLSGRESSLWKRGFVRGFLSRVLPRMRCGRNFFPGATSPKQVCFLTCIARMARYEWFIVVLKLSPEEIFRKGGFVLQCMPSFQRASLLTGNIQAGFSSIGVSRTCAP